RAPGGPNRLTRARPSDAPDRPSMARPRAHDEGGPPCARPPASGRPPPPASLWVPASLSGARLPFGRPPPFWAPAADVADGERTAAEEPHGALGRPLPADSGAGGEHMGRAAPGSHLRRRPQPRFVRPQRTARGGRPDRPARTAHRARIVRRWRTARDAAA